MDQEPSSNVGAEIALPPTPKCVLCGNDIGSYNFYHGSRDKDLYLCVDCVRDVMRSVSWEELKEATVGQVKRHMEVRDQLAATYHDSFVATKTFCIGKRRTVPLIEVDEERGLWALPKAPMPMALPLSSILDVEVRLTADDLDESGEIIDEIFTEAKISDLVPYVSTVLNWLYRSKHTDLAPIPEGRFVSYLYLVLTLDEQTAGLGKMGVDLLPFLISLPSRVNAGYDCAYDFIVYLQQIASAAYKKRRAADKGLEAVGNDRLTTLAHNDLITNDEAEALAYYLERIPDQSMTGTTGSLYGLVKSVVDAVCEHLMFDEKVPDLKTQHTTGVDTFLGAFYRYAPGLSVGDVVYIMDGTNIQSGKGGLLFARDCFAVDDFALGVGESAVPRQPIAYDDLLFVGQGPEKGQLVLAYRDGRRMEVNGGKYAHFIFAAVNCILLLRP